MAKVAEAKLSQLDEDMQQQVLASYPKIIKALLKRLGGRVIIPAKELDGMSIYVLSMGMELGGDTVRLEIQKSKKESMN